MSDNEAISQDQRTNGMGLWTDAKDMLKAARLVLADESMSRSSPVFYLAGHGIEEAFKAFLRCHGKSLEDLKKIGHNLDCALNVAISNGFEELCPLTIQDKKMISAFNGYYQTKKFEYRVTGLYHLPPPKDLIDLGERMLTAIKSICVASAGVVRP
jgi:hypothetical protein